jgi:23S rRNA (adenine2503-C2)-methyltransferase
MTSLAGLTLKELEKELSFLPRFRSSQIHKWIMCGAVNFDQMTNLPKSVRNELKSCFRVYSSVNENCYNDTGTKKIVLRLEDGEKIESVLLKDGKKRLTACLSTQAGCPAGCVFCKTGSLGFSRNLNCGEIIEQFLFLKNLSVKPHEDKVESFDQTGIDNIVIMGMGEPLLNTVNLRKAVNVFTDPAGMNFSRRRITVSTCGICEGLSDIAKNGPYVRLALSLTTADEPLRQKLMPVTALNPLSKVKESLVLFQKNGGGRITLETPLLGGVNTRSKDAALTAVFAENLDTVVNIIPWNPVAGLEFQGKPLREPDKKETDNYAAMLKKHGLKVTMRLYKGRRVMGACGQLGIKY